MQFKSPYFSIWFHTKPTIDKVLSERGSFFFFIPLLMNVVSVSLTSFRDLFEMEFLEGKVVVPIILVILIIAIGYFFIGVFYPWLIFKCGKLWKGEGTFRELQIIVGLAHIPVLLILIEQVLFLSFGKVLPDTEANYLLQWFVWLFFMRILIIGIAKVQNFDYGIAILNIIIPVLPVFIFILLTSA